MPHRLPTGRMVYEKVASSEEELDTIELSDESRRPWNRIVVVILAANLLLFAATFVFYIVAMSERLKTPHGGISTVSAAKVVEYPEECGRTVEEAQSNDCVLDIMSNLWTPKRCYNSTFALETFHGVVGTPNGGGVGAPVFGLNDYLWYEDEDRARPIKNSEHLEHFLLQQDKRGLPLEAFTHMSFHAAHCSYFQRMAVIGLDRLRRGDEHVWIPRVTTEPGHARHCEFVFGELYRLGHAADWRNWTKVGFGFTPCVRLG